MVNYYTIIFYSLVGGLFSLVGGVLLLSKKSSAAQMAKYATPFAAGALLAGVFADLLPEGVTEANPETVFYAALAGIIVFFFAERFLHWFHHHHQHGQDPKVGLIIIGDTLHNGLDGVAIAAAFLVSFEAGIVTTIVIAAHEIPQEIGDFGLLLHKGLSRTKVVIANVISALATTVMAVITFALGSTEHLPLGILVGASAGFLLYIAMSDIIPEIHESSDNRRLFSWQPILLVSGVVVVIACIKIAHQFNV